MSHTSGPWEATERYDAVSGTEAAVWGPDGDQIAMVHSNLGLGGDAIENARLIAAAPELLAACKAALGAFERNDCINWDDLTRAIDKAEGK